MQVFDWPSKHLVPFRWDLRLINRTRSAGRSLTGFEQVVSAISPRWALTLEFNTLRKEAILPFRALVAKLEGRANAVKVPIPDNFLWASDASLGLENRITRYDRWPSYDSADESADVNINISGTRGETSATVSFSSLDEPELIVEPGMYFGAGDDLHMITDLEWAGSDATITFKPAFAQNHTVSDFRFRPTLTCRLADDESGSHPLERSRKTAPTLDLMQILPGEIT